MEWQANTLDLQPHPLADLHVKKRKRYGNTSMSLQEGVEKTIGGIVIIFCVAMKVFLLEEDLIYSGNYFEHVCFGWKLWEDIWCRQSEQTTYAQCERVELGYTLCKIEVWIFAAGNQESR